MNSNQTAAAATVITSAFGRNSEQIDSHKGDDSAGSLRLRGVDGEGAGALVAARAGRRLTMADGERLRCARRKFVRLLTRQHNSHELRTPVIID